jgi:hypothetical protein
MQVHTDRDGGMLISAAAIKKMSGAGLPALMRASSPHTTESTSANKSSFAARFSSTCDASLRSKPKRSSYVMCKTATQPAAHLDVAIAIGTPSALN